jgi:hypothetical protein
VNGRPVAPRETGGFLQLDEPPRSGDRVVLALEHRVSVETRDGRRLAPSELAEPTEGLLCVGPLLYAVDDGLEPLFFGEPWLAGNVVRLPAQPAAPAPPPVPQRFSQPSRHLEARYEHAGFAGAHPVSLRPVGEQAGREPGIVGAWLKYRREG